MVVAGFSVSGLAISGLLPFTQPSYSSPSELGTIDMEQETAKATNEQMQDLVSWRQAVAERFPAIFSRVFILRAQEHKGMSTGSLEARFAWHLSQAHSRKRVAESDIELEKNSFDNLTLALAKAEWSAANKAADPDAPGAPWGPQGTPAERLQAQMDRFEHWVVENATANAAFIKAAQDKIEENDITVFSDLLIDGLHDFKSHIVQRALQDEFWTNNGLARNGMIQTDEWFHDLRSSVANRDLTAMIYDRGHESLLAIMDKIAQPAAQPGI
jgi:hypothetical protein